MISKIRVRECWRKIWKWSGQEVILWVNFNYFFSTDLFFILRLIFLLIAADGDIFTGILYDHYTAPAGFCFDEASHTQCHDKSLNGNYRLKALFANAPSQSSESYKIHLILFFPRKRHITFGRKGTVTSLNHSTIIQYIKIFISFDDRWVHF